MTDDLPNQAPVGICPRIAAMYEIPAGDADLWNCGSREAIRPMRPSSFRSSREIRADNIIAQERALALQMKADVDESEFRARFEVECVTDAQKNGLAVCLLRRRDYIMMGREPHHSLQEPRPVEPPPSLAQQMEYLERLKERSVSDAMLFEWQAEQGRHPG